VVLINAVSMDYSGCLTPHDQRRFRAATGRAKSLAAQTTL